MDNKCVYLHKDFDGVVKYVGSGTIDRAYKNHARSYRGRQYKEFVEKHGKLNVEIVAEGLSKLDAENLERSLFDQHVDTILNHSRPVSARPVDKELLEKYLFYDETSSTFLRWKIDIISGQGAVRIKAGSEAGSLDKSRGYHQVILKRRKYYNHRVICILNNMEVDDKVIDHIDRNRSNNCLSNLRVVTQQENCQNGSMRMIGSKNKSGVLGVCLDSDYNRWTTTWREHGKFRSKHFPVKDYNSSEEAFKAACEYRKLMVSLYYK